MNKKGFTLVELVVVVIILGVILAFALPNITSTLERNKKDQMIIDAKDMVQKAKNYALKTGYPTDLDSDPTTEECKEFSLATIDPRGELKESPFGKEYQRQHSDSFVKVCLKNGSYTYYVQLTDGSNKIVQIDYMELDKSEKYNKVIIGS